MTIRVMVDWPHGRISCDSITCTRIPCITGLVALAYKVARQYEDPFTTEIYAKRERERKEGKKTT